MWAKIQGEIDKLRKEGIDPYCISFNIAGYRRILAEAGFGGISILKFNKLEVALGHRIVLNPCQNHKMVVLTSPDDEFMYSEILAKIRWTDELTKDDFTEK